MHNVTSTHPNTAQAVSTRDQSQSTQKPNMPPKPPAMTATTKQCEENNETAAKDSQIPNDTNNQSQTEKEKETIETETNVVETETIETKQPAETESNQKSNAEKTDV